MYIYEPGHNTSKILKELENELPRDLVEKINRVLDKFGMKMPHKLEELVNKLLKLDIEKKLKYWGKRH